MNNMADDNNVMDFKGMKERIAESHKQQEKEFYSGLQAKVEANQNRQHELVGTIVSSAKQEHNRTIQKQDEALELKQYKERMTFEAEQEKKTGIKSDATRSKESSLMSMINPEHELAHYSKQNNKPESSQQRAQRELLKGLFKK